MRKVVGGEDREGGRKVDMRKVEGVVGEKRGKEVGRYIRGRWKGWFGEKRGKEVGR